MIALAWQADADWPVLLIANRDEFHVRAASPLAPVATLPGLLAGTDQVGGGHWLGVLPDGRFAAVTNARLGPASQRAPAARSRGELVGWALADQAQELPGGGSDHGPFGLLWIDRRSQLQHRSNAFASAGPLAAGLHVLSNGPLNADWPKARRARELLADWLRDDREQPARLLNDLADRRQAVDDQLPDTGVGLALERRLSPLFIDDPVYGTRCSTVMAQHRSGQLRVWERHYTADGEVGGEVAWDCAGGGWREAG